MASTVLSLRILRPSPTAIAGSGRRAVVSGESFASLAGLRIARASRLSSVPRRSSVRSARTLAIATETEEERTVTKEVDAVTRKWGLEAGLWKVATGKGEKTNVDRTSQAKELLARYGGAYLATSITLAIISFSICYFAIDAGVDVPALLVKLGIEVDSTGEKVGTFALAYAAHKAASPIRFPPTVALTPVVASWFGKKPQNDTGTTEAATAKDPKKEE